MKNRLITRILGVIIICLTVIHSQAQHTDANVFGDVKSNGEHIPFAAVFVDGTTIGTTTDETGHYMLIDLPEGTYILVARALGYIESKQEITIAGNKTIEVNFELKEELMAIDEVVVTGTKTFKRQTEAPVIVNVIDRRTIEAIQACNISEGLRFQPGLRVETDCQTCNYSQLRMNGLTGGYSQILINGRPVFSPLIGLYGMEQIPSNMVERIEVVRGGGSALYGSSAIGGTVNIITRMPTNNGYDVVFTSQSINGAANDNVINGSINMVTRKRNSGAVIFINRRHREAYDHTGVTLNSNGSLTKEKDNFSELPELRNNSFGANLFFNPTPSQKLELNFTSLYEYRYGGEITGKEAHLAQQSEERFHYILMGGMDYQVNFNQNNSSFIAYFAGQYTDRDHYTGIYPGRADFGSDAEFLEAEANHLKNPPYGYTYNTTLQAGAQINHRLSNFLGGINVLTAGLEFLHDDILDSIPAYLYGTNQKTGNFAVFAQSDWQIARRLSLLAGLRADKHNLVQNPVVSPRLSVLYRLKERTQFRLTWGTGFRAPQAFDTDMHIAFAGGGVSRISLADGLEPERSQSLSGSVNFDLSAEKYVVGYTIEGFYTRLSNAFFLAPLGMDALGETFEKQNGPGAVVKGATIEVRGNYNKKAQIEAGFTLQSSRHDKPVENISGLPAMREFLRTPKAYGYLVLTLLPLENLNASFSSIYTGSMVHAKFSPDESIQPNEYRTSASFAELNLKIGYTIRLESLDSGVEIFSGVKNIANKFQDDADNFKYRDSNYVYGPAQPRTFYFGIKLLSL
jgi:outer membrane receptor for ferrienterochelin and colicins